MRRAMSWIGILQRDDRRLGFENWIPLSIIGLLDAAVLIRPPGLADTLFGGRLRAKSLRHRRLARVSLACSAGWEIARFRAKALWCDRLARVPFTRTRLRANSLRHRRLGR